MQTHYHHHYHQEWSSEERQSGYQDARLCSVYRFRDQAKMAATASWRWRWLWRLVGVAT